MALYVVLADYADNERALTAGTVVDDAAFDVAALTSAGCALVALTPAIQAKLPAFLAQRGSRPADPDPSDLQAVLLAAGALGGSGGGPGVGEFIHADFGTQDEAQGRYVGTQGWVDLMAKLATIQIGASPVVRLAYTTGPFTVPLAGMPTNGWDFRGGSLTSFYGATGAVTLNVPPGVKLDNLFGIGGTFLGNGAVVVKIAPPSGTNVLNFSALPTGAAWIFVIGGGSAIDHSTDTGTLMQGPDANTTMVLVAAFSQQNTGLAPPLSGPLLTLGATDGAVSAQVGFGGLPDNWLVGGGPGSTLLRIYDASANPNTPNIGTWAPGFTGGGGINDFSFTLGKFIAYDDAFISPPLGATTVQGAIDALKAQPYTAGTPADWSGAPATLGAALDRLASAVAGLLGGPIP